ncbi:hypothetical protein INR49_032670, partial [Caranx melampygus]
ICDKEWHYYVINVEFPVVTLYVDGVTYDPYLVTDDWPIHPSQIDVQLTVGACWQGGEFHFNPAQSILVMEGEDLENMNTAVRKVSYINSRQFPTPGIRRLRISTTVQCFGEDTCITIPDIDAVVMVLQPSEPRITITGVERVSRPASDLRAPGGIALFQDLHIISTVTRADATAHHTVFHCQQFLMLMKKPRITKQDEGKPKLIFLKAKVCNRLCICVCVCVYSTSTRVLEEIIHNLDYCDILVLGEELRPGQESLQLQRSALLGKHLDATNSTSGMSIYGVDSMSNYEQVIRQVRYFYWQSGPLLERRFRLTCSELNGRYTSNEFNLEVSVLHSSEPGEHVNHIVAPPQYMQVVHHPSMIHGLYPSHNSGVPSAATVVIVMCIAALVVVVVLGIYRIHLTHQQEVKLAETAKEADATWNDSALTITVNPMENLEEPQAAEEEVSEEEEEEEEEEEDDDEDDDEDEEEEDDITSAESDDSEEE